MPKLAGNPFDHYFIHHLDRFQVHWARSEDGNVIDQNALKTLGLAPGAEKSMAIGYQTFTPKPSDL
jgi:hypothetical protein